MKSPAFSFRGLAQKMLKSLFLSLLGGLAAWLSTELLTFDLGVYHGFVGAMVPFLVNSIQNYIKEHK